MQPLQLALMNWAEELENYRTPKWDVLPDIDLYMDQVITYLERQTAIFSKSEEEKMITPAMINNYVKNEVIPRPIQKKYTREHLAHMIAVLNLKQVLSLSDITKLVSEGTLDKPINELFDQFNIILGESLQSTSIRVREALKSLEGDSDDDIEKRLSLLALKLSLEANASRIAAKRIIDEIMIQKAKNQEEEKEKNKEQGKEKDKSKDKKPS